MRKTKTLNKETKNKIIDAFWNLYKKNPISKITIKEITTIANINRSTFYEYFFDIYDVLEQAENELLEKLKDREQIYDYHNGKMLSTIVNIYKDNIEKLSLLLIEDGDPYFASKLKQEILKFAKLNSKGEKLFFEYHFSAIIGVLNYWYKNQNEFTLEELIEIIYPLIPNVLKEKNAN